MLDFTARGVRSVFPAFGAVFAVFELGGRLLVDARLVILHLAFRDLADEINVGVFSAWHNRGLKR